MNSLVSYIRFTKGLVLRSKEIGISKLICEITHYYKRYVKLPYLMGFDFVGLRYKLYVIYNYIKLNNYVFKKDKKYILDCVPLRFFDHFLSHRTEHFNYGFELIDKKRFYQLLNKNNIPFPKTFFEIKEKKAFNLNDVEIDLREFLHQQFFAKERLGSAGRNAEVVNYTGQDLSKYHDFIFQEMCTNHENLRKLAPVHAFCTIRIHSYKLKYEVKTIEIQSAHLKLNSGEGITDNIGTGGIAVPIDITTGKLMKYGYSEFNKNPFITHPLSNLPFEGFKLPYWQEIINLLEKTHTIFKSRMIAWDIGITDSGPIFIEGNSGGDIFIPQVFIEPFYNKLLIKENIINPVFHTKVKKYI